MRVNIKCDKNYNGGKPQTIDGSWVRSLTLQEIINRFAYINKNEKVAIDITESLVDFYNISVGGHSCKSAQAIAKYLRKQWLQNYADELLNLRKG